MRQGVTACLFPYKSHSSGMDQMIDAPVLFQVMITLQLCVCVYVESTVSNLSLSPCLMLIICCSPNLLDPDQCVFIGW